MDTDLRTTNSDTPNTVTQQDAARKALDAARKALDAARKALADVYTFVRSREINKTISSFTFDHWIDEAKRQIKGEGAAIRDTNGQALGLRPPELDEITRLEENFKKALESARKVAKSDD